MAREIMYLVLIVILRTSYHETMPDYHSSSYYRNFTCCGSIIQLRLPWGGITTSMVSYKIYSAKCFFEFNSDEIHQEYYTDLNMLGEVLISDQCSQYQVAIEGHTDSVGSERYNQLLSERRAKSVMKYLLQHFPPTSGRLIVRGYGKSKPIASNETPEGRSQNRRVEITAQGGEREREGGEFTDFRGRSDYTAEELARALFPPDAAPRPRGVQPAPPRETGRAFLVGNQPEDRGYGLYSYLLFGSPPTDMTRDRYRAAIITYLELIPASRALEEFLPRHQLNITYLPLKVRSPERLSLKEHTEWILAHYNYTRARALLTALTGTHREGPYIASSPTPLSGAKLLSGPYLYQDLSWVPSRLVHLWVKEFLNQASQERFEKKRVIEQFVLKLRTAIAILAEGLPEVREAFAEWGKEGMNVQEAVKQR